MVIKYSFSGTTTAHFTNGRTYIAVNLTQGTASFVDDHGVVIDVTLNADWTLATITEGSATQLYP